MKLLVPHLELSDDELIIIINSLGTDSKSDELRKKLIDQLVQRIFKFADIEESQEAMKRAVKTFDSMFKRLAQNGD